MYEVCVVMSRVSHVTVPLDDDGQRLDRWLKKQGLPFSVIQKLIRKGQVRVDGKRAKPDVKLSEGQVVRIPPFETSDKNSPGKTQKPLQDKDIEFIRSLIVYDQNDIIAINKPAGLATQGGPGIKEHVDRLLPALKNKEGAIPKLVHRLDKETSGVLLLARTREMAQKLGDALKARDVRKYYWALVSPAPDCEAGEIRAPLWTRDGNQKHKVVVNEENGKKALTYFHVVDKVGSDAAFVCFWPRTGRMHQIRVHAAYMGCPIIGDDKYGEERESVESMGLSPALHLHAHRVVVKLKGIKETIDIQVPLPDSQKRSWKSLGLETSLDEDPFSNITL